MAMSMMRRIVNDNNSGSENFDSKIRKNSNENVLEDKEKKRKHLAIIDSNEEDSPESSGDEYVHTGFKNDEDNKLVET